MVADCPINVVERLWLRTVPLMLWRDYGCGLPINVVERLWLRTVPLMLWRETMVADCPINVVERDYGCGLCRCEMWRDRERAVNGFRQKGI